MKASTISTLKKELATLPNSDVIDICMRLVKYKKENKELLSYLLFDANNELEYIRNIKEEIDVQFNEINHSQLYFAKKSIRKILKTTNKFVRYSGHKQTEVELLIHFCTKFKKSGIPIKSSNSFSNLYTSQVRKIHTAISALHEDLQHDYLEEMATLNL
jgi:membrane-anchored protein YejM (alkaline phosphatase superfamily)